MEKRANSLERSHKSKGTLDKRPHADKKDHHYGNETPRERILELRRKAKRRRQFAALIDPTLTYWLDFSDCQRVGLVYKCGTEIWED